MQQHIGQLADLLLEAAESKDPAQWGAARRALEDITGGKIVVTQQGEAKAKRGWLRGTFRVRTLHLLARHFGCDGGDNGGVEVSVDFREPPAEVVIAEQVKALFDQGMLYKDIAKQLNVYRPLVVKAIKYWFASRGLDLPDGRLRRFELEQRTPNAYRFQQIADEALRLYDQRLPMGNIVKQLGCDHTTVTKAIRHAQVQRGLTPIDGRTRRKTLSHQPAGSTVDPAATQQAGGVEPPSPVAECNAGTTAGPVAGDMPAEDARPAA